MKYEIIGNDCWLLINENTILITELYQNQNCDILLLSSHHCRPRREFYSSSEICAILEAGTDLPVTLFGIRIDYQIFHPLHVNFVVDGLLVVTSLLKSPFYNHIEVKYDNYINLATVKTESNPIINDPRHGISCDEDDLVECIVYLCHRMESLHIKKPILCFHDKRLVINTFKVERLTRELQEKAFQAVFPKWIEALDQGKLIFVSKETVGNYDGVILGIGKEFSNKQYVQISGNVLTKMQGELPNKELIVPVERTILNSRVSKGLVMFNGHYDKKIKITEKDVKFLNFNL